MVLRKREKVAVTPEGLEGLKQEYEKLVNIKRPTVVEKLRRAREMGDLSENAAYHTAREEQAYTEGRIAELEDILSRVVVIANGGRKGVVGLGNRVQVEADPLDPSAGEAGAEPEEFIIVGVVEADPAENKISDQSPIGRALMGKRVGDRVAVETPSGKLTFKIVGIQ